MAVREQLILDLTQALSQIDQLERELDGLFQPIVIPVDIETDAALGQLQRDINAVDNDDIDIDVNAQGVENAERSIGRLGDEFDDAEDSAQDYATAVDRADRETDQLGRTGTRAFGGLRTSLIGLAAAAGGIVALRGLGEFFGDSIQSASDLEESTSKAQVVFGDFFDDIQDFASTAPAALGLANSAALEFTGTFGNLFVALGLSQDAAADLAPEIVQLGADLASFNNLDVTDALDKLRAGLVGEAEPLRSLGVNLTAATVEAKALELGLAGVDGAISEAAKVQARYALILEQTTTAQGDFARTSDSIANRQRSIAAEFENLRAAVGEALIPAFEALLDLTPEIIAGVENMIPALAALGSQLGNLVTDGAPVISFLADLPRGFGAVGDIATGGLAIVGDILSRLGSAFSGGLIGDVEGFANALDQLGETGDNLEIRVIEQDVIDALRAGLPSIDAFVGALGRLKEGSTLDADSIQRFATITGVGADDAAKALNFILDTAELTDIELRDVLDTLIQILDIGDRGEGLNFERGRRSARDLKEELLNIQAIEFDELGNITGGLTFDINGIVSGVEDQFQRLPDAFAAVNAALQTEEDETLENFAGFLEDLEGEISRREAFRDDLALLRALGLDTLADALEQAGLNASLAASEAVDNIAGAIEANDALENAASRKGASFYLALIGAIQEQFDQNTPEFQISVEAVVGNVRIGQIPVFDNVVVPSGAGSNQTQRSGGGDVIINNNGILPSDTDSARTAQQVNAIVGNAR